MPRKQSIAGQTKELFGGVAAKDVAIVGGVLLGVGGAIYIGYQIVRDLTNQPLISTYTQQYTLIADDYIPELHQFVRQNGTGTLTPAQQSALDAKKSLMHDIEKAAADASAQANISFENTMLTAFFIGVAAVVIGKYGPKWIDALRGKGNPKTAESYIQIFEGAEVVDLAVTNVPLANAFYNQTMVSDSLTLLTELQLNQATLQAEITNLSGIALISAQSQLAAIQADVAFEPTIFTYVPPLI